MCLTPSPSLSKGHCWFFGGGGAAALMLMAQKEDIARNNRLPPRVADLKTDVSTERRIIQYSSGRV